MIVTTFYKYVRIPQPVEIQQQHAKYCKNLEIKGKILVSKEGINGAVSGSETQILKYKRYLKQNKLFSNVKFKDTFAENHPYKKMIVRLRSEIVTFGTQVNVKNSAEHVSPKTLKRWIEREQVILLDARNNYESKIGKFKGAITPDINTFREFPTVLRELDKHKNRKIVTYCTGGIRCEKASAFLKENGFSQVYQLDDGILNYIQKFPDDHFEGRCFVFDSRLSVPSGKKNETITTCDACHAPCGNYVNCKNVKCDKMFICCENCKKTLNNACSKKCKNAAQDVNKATKNGTLP